MRSFWHCAATNTPAAASRKPLHSAAQIAQRLRHSGVKMVEILGVLLYQKGDTAELVKTEQTVTAKTAMLLQI